MILSKDEAICLVLSLSDRNIVDSKTKLNKLLARLNLFFIPIDLCFDLNRFGSFSADLNSISSNDYFAVEKYEYKNTDCKKYIIKEKGQELFKTNVLKKLEKILKPEEYNELKEKIHELSLMKANEISDNEHKKLLVDVDDRFKLNHRLNEVLVDLLDLKAEAKKLKEDSFTSIRLKALIEYSYYLIKYLKEIRFKRLGEDEYDYDAHMLDYYFLYNIGKIIPFLQKQMTLKQKDKITINKHCQYIINSVKFEKYPFSLDNENLKNLIIA